MANLFNNQDINNFFQRALAVDFARQNLFRINYINGGSSGILFDQNDLVYVTATTLPQRAIKNVPVPFMGLSFNVPGTANYPGSEGWQVTLRMPADNSVRLKLEAWTRSTFDDQDGAAGPGSTGAYNLRNLGEVSLSLMDKQGIPSVTYNLIGAYCTNVGSYTLNATTAGEVVELPITIAYQFWTNPLVP